MTNKFELLDDAKSVKFNEHYQLNPVKSVFKTLNRRRLVHRVNPTYSDNRVLRKIIEDTASLRVSFGWCFENSTQFTCMMKECIDTVVCNHAYGMNGIVSDITCDWFGFKPYNVFECVVFEDLSTYGLIIFNNELVNYQISILNSIQSHPLYLGHAMIKDDSYRFNYFKSIRKDPERLADSFHYVMSAINNVNGLQSIPRTFIEEMLGCHFLYYPDVFFEILDFYLLSGKLYD